MELTPKHMELLGILQEECAEVIQIISKIRRFGITSYNPVDDVHSTNKDLLNLEIADVLAVIDLLKEQQESLIMQEAIDLRIPYKKTKIERYSRA